MKTGIVLAAALALASFPLVAQMPGSENPQQSNPAAQPSNPPTTVPPAAQPDQPGNTPAATPEQSGAPTNPATAAESSATPATAAAEAGSADMRPVKGELVSKLDTKTAKTGDDVVVETKAAVKTADGTEIPKGSKLMGHIVAVKASTDGDNSQIALQFDHAELAGGQSLPIQTQIRSIGPAEGASSASDQGAPSESSMSRPSPGGTAGGNGAGTPGAAPGAEANAASSGALTAGTVVARNGKIAIEATSIPGVLLANNEPGEQDPRLAQASSILLGARKDVQLDSGTPVELNVAAAAGGASATK